MHRLDKCRDCGRFARLRAVNFLSGYLSGYRVCSTCHRSYGSAVWPVYRKGDR